MTLASGAKLGPYEIQSLLGTGGMGEVYRALDTRLDRAVAIKVLASHLSSSPESKQRMEREARAISALNHPRICQLYDVGSHDGSDYLVMEFLEGETLAERLRKGAMPLNEILKVGIAIAEALAVAHRQGFVHRDLKPGNIMLTASGAKLMDFGLAKPLALTKTVSGSASMPAFTAVATMSGASPLTPLTTAGSIVGTIQYMSPEQIEGKEADARSDIFAFGAVLYEMTTGNRPFQGKSQISLASSILEKDPDPISTVTPTTPPAFEHVITTCLQKDPEDRFQTAHDIKLELQWIAAQKPVLVTHAEVAAAPIRPSRFPWIAALVAALIAAAALALLFYRPHPTANSVRAIISAPDKAMLNLSGDSGGPPVLSPDGTQLAFTATGADGKVLLWVRPMNSLEAHPVPDTDGAIFPFWSPDNSSLGFFAHGQLKTVDLNGSGAIQVLAESGVGRGGAWGPGGVILYSANPTSPMLRINAKGGEPTPITNIDLTQHTSHRWPYFLPDGKHYLYLAINHEASKAANDTLYYASLDGHENRSLFHSQSSAVYGNGYLLFARGNVLLAQAFDPDTGTLSGEPHTVAHGVMNDASNWHLGASVSRDGLLVIGNGGDADQELVWLDRTGKQLGQTRQSPDGEAFSAGGSRGSPDRCRCERCLGARSIPRCAHPPHLRPSGEYRAPLVARREVDRLYLEPQPTFRHLPQTLRWQRRGRTALCQRQGAAATAG
jgi:hypothetical protein